MNRCIQHCAATATPSHIKSQKIDTANFRLQKFLPPESPKKFVYVLDAKSDFATL